MADLTFQYPTRVWFGRDCINRAGLVASPLGKRAILITEAILYERGVIERVSQLMSRRGLDPILFDEVVPNATSAVVDEALRIARGAHVDLVMGLGGVKTLSIARAVAVACRTDLDADTLLGGASLEAERFLPLVILPTTFRDPFLFGSALLLTDARDRTARIVRTGREVVSATLVDPTLGLSVPGRYLLAIQMDILLHAIEGYISPGRNFFSETLFARAITTAAQALSRDEGEDELRPRVQAAEAGLLTAMGLATTRSGAGCALAYALNARLRIPKSWAATILLPHVLEFNISAATDELRRVGELLGDTRGDDSGAGSSSEAAGRTIEWIRTIVGRHKLPARLRDFELELDGMVEIAETAHNLDLMGQLPRAASAEDLYEILKAAF